MKKTESRLYVQVLLPRKPRRMQDKPQPQSRIVGEEREMEQGLRNPALQSQEGHRQHREGSRLSQVREDQGEDADGRQGFPATLLHAGDKEGLETREVHRRVLEDGREENPSLH